MKGLAYPNKDTLNKKRIWVVLKNIITINTATNFSKRNSTVKELAWMNQYMDTLES